MVISKKELWDALKTIPVSDRKCVNCKHEGRWEAAGTCDITKNGIDCVNIDGFNNDTGWEQLK